MKIVQFLLSQALVLKLVFNFFAADTLFCSYTNDSVCVCVCVRVRTPWRNAKDWRLGQCQLLLSLFDVTKMRSTPEVSHMIVFRAEVCKLLGKGLIEQFLSSKAFYLFF